MIVSTIHGLRSMYIVYRRGDPLRSPWNGVSLVFPFLWFEDRVVDQYHILIVQSHVMGLCTSISKGMLEPVGVVTLLVVGTVVCAATLCACQRTVYGGLCAVKQEAKLNRLNQLCIEGLALVLQLHVLVGVLQSIKRIKSVSQATVVTLDKHPIDHLVLQRTAYRGCRFATGRGIEVIE